MNLDNVLATSLHELAEARRAVFGVDAADAWFDGFWDFFVHERMNLRSARSWWTSGTWWYVVYWHRPGSDQVPSIERRLDVFVESKDRSQRAPWPVTSIDLATGREIASSYEPRRGDPASIAALEAQG